MSSARVRVGERWVGPGCPVFVIAEIGASHGGDVEVASRLVEAAAKCGANAVKLQTIWVDESYVPETPSYEIFKDLWFDRSRLERLMGVARDNGVVLFSTPGDRVGLALMQDVGMPLIKISSGLMTNVPLVRRAAATGLPLVISTGMSYLDEVGVCVRAAEEAGCRQLMLMHCTSLYPAPAEALNLRAIRTLARVFPYPVGYSDHYDGATACVAAAALGARLLEKHFTLDRNLPGPDQDFSSDPAELQRLVREVRAVEAMRGSSVKAPVAAERPGRDLFRRCVVARRAIRAGETISEDAVAVKRPRGGRQGVPPVLLEQIVGLRAARDVARDEAITLDMLTGGAGGA